jgi:two-component system, NtrC family, sensor kinase
MPMILLAALCAAAIITCIAFAVLFSSARKDARFFKRSLDMKNIRHNTTVTEKITLSKNQLETAFDAITDFICALDENLTITRVNRSYSQFVQIPIPQLLGRHCWEVFWKRTAPCEHCPAAMTFANGKPVLKRSMKMPGKDRPLLFTVATYPVFDGPDAGAEKPQNVIEHIRDSTEEKAILEQLIRSEKLASIGTMTAGIAHEMINPLSGISGTAANMLQMPEKYGLNEKGASRVTTILESSTRASAIVKDLLHLSRKEEGTSMLTDINSMVLKAVDSVQLKGFPLIDHKINTDGSLGRVLCDPIKIEQVIINLLTNAVQSVLEKKALLSREGKQFAGLILIATQAEEDHARIDITDNGTGVPEEIKDKIFDPFFTTRPPGEGTGLGLSICQKIVDEHNGRIFFESSDTHTTFSVLLPLHIPEPLEEKA